MKKYELSIKDIDNNYFHFTKKSNLKSIEKKGLIPKIGSHAVFLEVTEKVFFVEGLDNLLCLFDCWIHVCEKHPHIPGLFNIGGKVMLYDWFPESLIYAWFKYTDYNKFHRFVAYKYFDWFLKKFVLLNIDIKEKEDFSYDDVDQIKDKGYKKEFLIMGGYSDKYSNFENTKMDKWNLHTFSNKGVKPNKLKMCYTNDSCNMYDILNYALNNTKLDIKEICPDLYRYLKKRKIL